MGKRIPINVSSKKVFGKIQTFEKKSSFVTKSNREVLQINRINYLEMYLD